ncbi:hypothetical protein N8T08_000469 [Aspergillus melleus]|uniref:Uncharacterized protein n=1 Tax=Aspergillus melleus TaxID=138277 RepID=A0ACC3BBA5_9EURO|nr:hypothetical protein N8T08_000469 [Aspergillus melleus]
MRESASLGISKQEVIHHPRLPAPRVTAAGSLGMAIETTTRLRNQIDVIGGVTNLPLAEDGRLDRREGSTPTTAQLSSLYRWPDSSTPTTIEGSQIPIPGQRGARAGTLLLPPYRSKELNCENRDDRSVLGKTHGPRTVVGDGMDRSGRHHSSSPFPGHIRRVGVPWAAM